MKYLYSWRFYFLIINLSLLYSKIYSQTNLLPSIGTTSLPADSDSICSIPVSSPPNGDFNLVGYQNGDTIPHFKLYSPNGDSIDIEKELNKGLPVLLIGGSYTCPVYRGLINDMNAITSSYTGQVSVFIIYVVEAHPIVDMNPYIGVNNVTQDNYNDNVLYEQPETYGERKYIISEMEKNYSVTPTILIDGICNEWWLNFGPAPNNAYLINTNGVIFSKQGWFNKAPYNMSDDIDSLLAMNISSGNQDISNSFSGNLTLYPNPAKQDMTFNLEGKDNIQRIIIRNNMGMEINRIEKVNQRLLSLKVDYLISGIYIYEIQTHLNQKICGKFIKY